MASNIKFKRSAVQNRVPTTAQLALGELALNTYDGKLYTEINTGSAAVVEIGSKLSSLVVDGDNGAGGGDVTFHGTTAGKDLIWDYSANKLVLNDNTTLQFGTTSGDSQFFHSGGDLHLFNNVGNTFVKSSSVYNIQAGHIRFRNHANNEDMANFYQNGQVALYFDSQERLRTTTDGVDIFGTGSLKIPVGTTAQRSASPVAGDLRYNTTTSSFEGYSTAWGDIGAGGIGVGSDASNPRTGIIQNRVGVGFTDLNIVGAGISVTGYGTTVFVDFNEFKPGSFHRTIHNYTATAGQTTFAGLNYQVSAKQIAVYLNGARLSEATYTATSGTTVVLDVGASVGDEVEIINIHTNSDVDRKVNTYTATAGQTTFTGLSYNSKTELDVYLNGIRLASDDFTATSGNTVVLAVGASVNDTIDIVSTGDGVTWRSTTDASGDVYKLTNVGIGTDQTPDKLNVRGNSSFVGVTTFNDDVNFTGTYYNGWLWDKSADLIRLKDNTRLYMGSSANRFNMRHDGTYNWIQNQVSNPLLIDGGSGGVAVISGANYAGGKCAQFIHNGAVELYHDNSKKFETTSTGASVTGNLAVSGVLTYDDVTNVDAVGIITARAGIVVSGGTLKIPAVSETNHNADLPVLYRVTSTGVIEGGSGLKWNPAEDSLKIGGTGAGGLQLASQAVRGNGSQLTLTTQNNNGNCDIILTDKITLKTQDNNADAFVLKQGSNEYITVDTTNSSELITLGNTTTNPNISILGSLTVSEGSAPATGPNFFFTDQGSATTLGTAATLRVANDGGNAAYSVFEAESGSGSIRLANDGQFYVTGSAKFSTRVRVDKSSTVDGFMGEAYTGYFGLKHTDQTLNSEYMILSQDSHTFISASSGSSVYIRGGGNSSTNQMIVSTSGTTIGGNLVLTTANEGSGNGLDADTLDGVQGASFLRSDATDTASGAITFTSGSLTLSSHYYQLFYSGTTNYIHLYPNGHTGNASVTNIRAYNGVNGADTFQITGGSSTGLKWRGNTIWTAENDGSGSGLDADTVDGIQGVNFLRSDTADTASGDITFSGGAGAATIGGGSDIRLTTGNWTGDAYAKIQHHSNQLYIAGGSNTSYSLIFRYNNQDRVYFKSNGTIWPQSDSTSDLGTSANRWANVYADTLYGNGSNITAVNATTLDSIDSSSFLRSDATDTCSGQITHTNKVIIDHNSSTMLELKPQNSSPWVIGINRDDLDQSRVFVHNANGLGWVFEHRPKFYNSGSYDNFLTTGDEGSGNGLDADTVDGLQASSFVRSDAADTISGSITFGSGSGLNLSSNDIYFQARVMNNPNTSTLADGMYIGYGNGNNGATRIFGGGTTSGGLVITGNGASNINFNSQKVFYSGNDGSGSGLDADLLDGVQGSSFLRSDASDTASGEITFSGSIQVANSIVHQGDGDTRITFGTNTIELDTAGTQRMSILSDGDVIWNNIGTDTPGHGNSTQGMGFEPRNGSIFLSRSDNGTIFSNRNSDGSHIGLKRSGTDKFHIGLNDAGSTFRISSGNMGGGTSRFEIDSNGHTRATVRARTLVNSYKDSITNTGGCLTGGANDKDAWIYNFFDNASWGIYHRNIDSTLDDSGFGLPQNSTAFIGNANLAAYISHESGVICSKGGFLLDGKSTTTNQAIGIRWSGFDKEATSDRSDIAGIIHTVNQEGLAGGVLRIFSDNDDNDGVVIKGGNSSGAYGTRIINGLQIRSGAIKPTAGGGTDGIIWPSDPYGGSGDIATIQYYQDGGGEDTRFRILIGNDANDDLRLEGNTIRAQGSFSKANGSFRIPHVLAGLTTTTDLVHSFVEGPQADNLYRGRTKLVAGISTVNIDTTNNMTDGTFVNLNRDVQCFTSNETGWTAVKGSVTGNLLTIIAQDNTCTDTISWMVVGERWDLSMYDPRNPMTDVNGKVKTEIPNDSYGKTGEGFEQDYVRENRYRVGISTISRPSIENKEVE